MNFFCPHWWEALWRASVDWKPHVNLAKLIYQDHRRPFLYLFVPLFLSSVLVFFQGWIRIHSVYYCYFKAVWLTFFCRTIVDILTKQCRWSLPTFFKRPSSVEESHKWWQRFPFWVNISRIWSVQTLLRGHFLHFPCSVNMQPNYTDLPYSV